jgi:hypothetical protein
VLGRVLILSALIALAVAGAIFAAPSAPRTSFAPGTWTGSAPVSGTITRSGISITGRGGARFTFTVRGTRVTSGTMNYNVAERGTVAGKSFTGSLKGKLRVSGSARRPSVTGTLRIAATVLGQPLTSSVPANGSFSGSGTCSHMTGDLAVQARAAQQAAGFGTNVTARFNARRTSGGACS